MCCGQRAVPTAPRKISGPSPRRPPVLGELLRGKTNPTPLLLQWISGLRRGRVLKRIEKPDTDLLPGFKVKFTMQPWL